MIKYSIDCVDANEYLVTAQDTTKPRRYKESLDWIEYQVAGYIQVQTSDESEVYIEMIEVGEDYRRRSIVTNMLKLLQKTFSDAVIDWGYTTDEGSKLYNKVVDKDGKIIESLNDNELIAKVSAELGMFDEPPLTSSYILPNGKYLLTDKVPTKNSFVNHADIERYLINKGYVKERNEYKMTREGYTLDDKCIRINIKHEGYIVITNRPTEAQYQALLPVFDKMIERGKTFVGIWYGTYMDGTSKQYYFKDNLPEDIIKKIKRYFTSGSLVEKLSDEQIKYFKDSKIRDKEGNLLICYHGTPNAGFTEFNPKESKSQFGKYKFDKYNINYFTTELETAKGYTELGVGDVNGEYKNIYACYLNIKNPYIVNNKTKQEMGRTWKNITDDTIRNKQISLFKRFWSKWCDSYPDEYDLKNINKELFYLNCKVTPSTERPESDKAPYSKEDGLYDLCSLGDNTLFGRDVLLYSYSLEELFDSDMYEEFRDAVVGDIDNDKEDYFFTIDNIIKFVLLMNEEDNKNYDGIIIPDISDIGPKGNLFGPNTTDIITLISPNQIKRITNIKPTFSNNIDEDIQKVIKHSYIESNEINYHTDPVVNDDIFDTKTIGAYGETADCIPGSPENDYMLKIKHKKGEIIQLSPEEYFQICSEKFDISYENLKASRMRDKEQLEKLTKVITEKKVKFPITYLDFSEGFSQEGLHRMIVAGELFDWEHKFPVLLVKSTDKESVDSKYIQESLLLEKTKQELSNKSTSDLKENFKSIKVKVNNIDEAYLTEATRTQLINKSKNADSYSPKNRSKGKNRYERRLKSQIASSVRQYNKIDMDAFFKRDILTVGIEVHGETNDYVVTMRFNGALQEIAREVKANNGKLAFKSITRAMSRVFNQGNVFVRCTCPDFKYRQAYWASKSGYGTQYEPRPSDITNPRDSKGGGCKHTLLVLSNLDWMMKAASVINNYIKYCQKNMQYNYSTYIFPKIYGMPYKKAVQLGLFDDGILPSDQKTLTDIADKSTQGKDSKGRWVAGNQYRFAKKSDTSQDNTSDKQTTNTIKKEPSQQTMIFGTNRKGNSVASAPVSNDRDTLGRFIKGNAVRNHRTLNKQNSFDKNTTVNTSVKKTLKPVLDDEGDDSNK